MTGIQYYEYAAKTDPNLVNVAAHTLYYMFMFHLTSGLVGVDISLKSALVKDVYERMVEIAPKFNGKDAKAYYCDSEDASFCRAIGNACLEANQQFLKVTSTRNEANLNIILPGEGGSQTDPLGLLSPAGRSSFYYDGDSGVSAAEVTTDDMAYNAQFGN